MSNREQERQKEGDRPESGGATPWEDYFWVSLIFYGFLAVLTYATWVSCQAPGDDQTQAVAIVLRETLWFFGLLMGGGFALVLLFDAAYQFFAGKAGQAPSGGEPPKA